MDSAGHLYRLEKGVKVDARIKDLFLKYMDGACNSEELDEVFMLIKSGSHEVEWDAALQEDENSIHLSDNEPSLQASEAEHIYKRIEQGLFSGHRREPINSAKGRFKFWPLISGAAATFLLVGGAYFFWKRNDIPPSVYAKVEEVRPGGNKAFLTLSNGKRISLTDAANGNIATQAGIKIAKTAAGQVIYIDEGNASVNGGKQFNTIETPRGGQYQIRLPDGTSVWLNAASSLIYPINFKGSRERRVELHGEAYFDVAKDRAHPFVVKTDKQEVAVLGTQFNINGYKDEPVISTTLVEGRVRTSDLSSGESRVLLPGQRSTVYKRQGQIAVDKVDTDNVISWKDGYFIFDNQDITSIMKVISRWYDVDVEYKGVSSEEKFGGTFSRASNLADILKVLKILGKVDFKVEGKTIIVSN